MFSTKTHVLLLLKFKFSLIANHNCFHHNSQNFNIFKKKFEKTEEFHWICLNLCRIFFQIFQTVLKCNLFQKNSIFGKKSTSFLYLNKRFTFVEIDIFEIHSARQT